MPPTGAKERLQWRGRKHFGTQVPWKHLQLYDN
jgi:hypothetical protein